MIIHHLSQEHSILHHFLSQLRDVHVQRDSMRFRKNIERIGQVMAYEISKTLAYEPVDITTPLGVKPTHRLADSVVLCSILRAGLALHQGFMEVFDDAENGFVSAYRHHLHGDDRFEIKVEYRAAPSFVNKDLILVDPMLATGQSIEAVYRQITDNQQPKSTHIAVVIAAPEGIAFLEKHLPADTHLWIGDLDEKLTPHQYIFPGLGDAGDLAYGSKL